MGGSGLLHRGNTRKFTEQNCKYEGVVSCQRDNMTLIVKRAFTNFQEYVFKGCAEMAVSRDN